MDDEAHRDVAAARSSSSSAKCGRGRLTVKAVRGHWHALLHKMFDDGGDAPSADPVPSPGWAGGHIYSRDGISWSRQQRAYSTNVTLETGEVLLTARRERPKLIFDADGRPTHLTNGAILPGGETYTIIAPLDV